MLFLFEDMKEIVRFEEKASSLMLIRLQLRFKLQQAKEIFEFKPAKTTE